MLYFVEMLGWEVKVVGLDGIALMAASDPILDIRGSAAVSRKQTFQPHYGSGSTMWIAPAGIASKLVAISK
jgi:hypothetical protein